MIDAILILLTLAELSYYQSTDIIGMQLMHFVHEIAPGHPSAAGEALYLLRRILCGG